MSRPCPLHLDCTLPCPIARIAQSHPPILNPRQKARREAAYRRMIHGPEPLTWEDAWAIQKACNEMLRRMGFYVPGRQPNTLRYK